MRTTRNNVPAARGDSGHVRVGDEHERRHHVENVRLFATSPLA
jgi:hypothetical protein